MPISEFGEKVLKVAEKINDPEYSASLREIVLKYGMISVRKKAIDQCEEQLETAVEKYYKIMLAPDDYSVLHWNQCLVSALKQLEKANYSKKIGFIVFESELNKLLSEINYTAFSFACKKLDNYNLDLNDKQTYQFYNENLSLEDLYSLAGIQKPNYTTIYKQ